MSPFSRLLTRFGLSRQRCSPALMETLYATAPVGLCFLDGDMRYVCINETLAAAHGVSVAEHLGRRVSEIMAGPLGEKLEQVIRRVYETGVPVVDHAFRAASAAAPGQVREWVVSYLPVRGGDGSIQGVSAVVRDITERRRAQADAVEAREHLGLALRSARAAAWSWDLKTGAMEWGDELADLLGIPSGTPPSVEAWQAVVFPEDAQQVATAIAQAVAEGRHEVTTQYRVHHPRQGVRHILRPCRILYDAQGQAERVLGLSIDITEQKRVEQAMRENAHRFRSIFEEAAIGMENLTLDGRLIEANDKLCQILGRSREELLSMTFEDITDPEDLPRERALLQPLLERRVPSYTLEKRYIHKSGARVWVRITSSMVWDGGARGPYRVTIVEDITAQRQAEEALKRVSQEAERAKAEAERANLAKSKFLAAASHDLRQPVQSLVLFLEAVKLSLGESAAREPIQHMEAAIQALNAMLSSLLDISRLDAGVVVPSFASVDIGALLRRIGREYAPRAAQKGLRLRAVAGHAYAFTDSALAERILRNLVENAIKYTQTGGVVVGLRRRRGLVRIEVADSGLGIPAEKQDTVFEEFYQIGNEGRDRARGLGLGLSIVKRLATLLGGAIDLRSEPGRGSRFTLTLPAAAAQTGHALPGRRPDHALAGKRILVIDDEELVRVSLRTLLEAWGHEVADAESGEQALAVAERFAPQAVVADYRLSGPLNGVDAAKHLGARAGRAMPTIIVTGDTAPERIQEVHASGFLMLHKPVAPDELRRGIGQLFGGPPL